MEGCRNIVISNSNVNKERGQEIDEADGVFCFWHGETTSPRAPSPRLHLNHWLLNQEKKRKEKDKLKNVWKVLTGIQVCNANALK